jgi:hypothetical protein
MLTEKTPRRIKCKTGWFDSLNVLLRSRIAVATTRDNESDQLRL